MRQPLLDEAMSPKADRAFRHPEDGLHALADTEPTRVGMLPWEEGQDGAGLAHLVAVVEMVGSRIVEIDRPLDQTQAEHAAVEIEIAAGLAGDGGYMMNAVRVHLSCPSGQLR